MNFISGAFKKHWMKMTAWVNILFQVIFPLAISLTPAVTARAELPPQTQSGSQDDTENRIASGAMTAGSLLSGQTHAADAARGLATSQATAEVQDWLSRFGNSRVTLSADKNMSLKNSQADILLPLAERDSDLLFTQGNIHRTDDRSQMNLGLGARHFAQDFMLGASLFYDRDLSRGHSRIGVGTEYWRDNLKLAANAYRRLSGWKSSPDFDDYLERPASGWDVRAEGFLPVYPQLGAKVVYEQYYGDEVALFGKDKLQRNPYAVTAGVSYTPVPLVSLSADQRQGKGSANDTRLGLSLNWQMGVPLRDQLSGDSVAALRSLQGSRYDFVDRNNNIVLEYKKETVITLVTPDTLHGPAGTVLPLTVQTSARHGLDRIDWSAASLEQAGGSITGNGSSYSVQLPALQATTRNAAANTYVLQATAVDKKGNRTSVQETVITVDAPDVSTTRSAFEPAHTVLPADGKATQTLTLTVQDEQGQAVDVPVADISMKVVSDHNPQTGTVSDLKAAGNGKYTVTVTAGQAEEILTLTPAVRGVTLSSAEVIEESPVSHAAFTATPDTITADGTTAATLSLALTNSDGEPVNDQTVTFVVTGTENTTVSAVTGTNGIYTAQLTGTTAGQVTIVPQVNGTAVSGQSATITLTADISTAQISGELQILKNNRLQTMLRLIRSRQL